MSGIVAQNVGRTSGLVKAAAAGGGVWTLIKTLTSDGSDSDLSFVDGSDDVTLDSTYPIYVFKFINIHCETDDKAFQFNMSVDTGSNYNVAKTTTAWEALHAEADATGLSYEAAKDLAQGTGVQPLAWELGNDNDQSCSGYLYLFNPSSTTFVKHFFARINSYVQHDKTFDSFVGGYGNTTSAVDAIQFSMSSGEIQGGKIKLYGIGDS